MSDVISAGKEVRPLRSSEVLPNPQGIPEVRVLRQGKERETSA